MQAVRLLEGGQKIVEIEFSAQRGSGGVTQSIVVVVVLSSILTLMRDDVRNPLFQTVCKSVVQLNIERYGQTPAMVSDPSPSTVFHSCVLGDECHSFTLPFKSNNALLLAALMNIPARFSGSRRRVFLGMQVKLFRFLDEASISRTHCKTPLVAIILS